MWEPDPFIASLFDAPQGLAVGAQVVTYMPQFDPTRVSLPPVAVDAGEAAMMLGISRSMFYKLLDAGRIGPRGSRLGRCLRFSVAEMTAWAEAGMPRREEWVHMWPKGELHSV